MPIEGVDYSFDRPTSPGALYAAGKRFAARYLALPPNGKIIDRAEADGLAKAGVWIVANWEQSGSGSTSPETAARESLEQARALGIPRGRPIYASVDFDVQPGDFDRVQDWITRFHKGLGGDYDGRALYGSYAVIKSGFDHGWLKWGWQTYAWSYGDRDPRAQLYQYSNGHTVAGCAVDLDRAYHTDYGQWMPGKSPSGEEQETMILNIKGKSGARRGGLYLVQGDAAHFIGGRTEDHPGEYPMFTDEDEIKNLQEHIDGLK